MARARSTSAGRRDERIAVGDTPNPVWFKPIMFGFMLIGLAWIVVFYISSAQFPISGIGSWNIVIGFGVAFVGFLMTLWWR
jgi:hypothetical protein